MADPRPCPICGKPAEAKHAPFCSGRCADLDLNRWLKGAYTIPVVEAEDPDTEAEAASADQDGSDRLH